LSFSFSEAFFVFGLLSRQRKQTSADDGAQLCTLVVPRAADDPGPVPVGGDGHRSGAGAKVRLRTKNGKI
jgi:hypothetical protein